MSVAEIERPRPLFGQITLEDMRGNELLTKTVMPLVGEACKHTKGKFNALKVVDGLQSGEYRLWGVMRPPDSLDAIVVTHAAGKVFDLLLLGPDFEDVFAFLPALAGVARNAGCERMRVQGPHFWRRRLPEGWKMSAVVYEKALEPR